MAGGLSDQVEDVVLAVFSSVAQAHGLRLDRDAALALNVHRVEHLAVHLALGEAAALLDQRSASVDLPWSMWAMMAKLRMWLRSVIDPLYC